MSTLERLVYPRLLHEFTTPRGHVAQMYYRKDTNDWNTIYASMTADEYDLKNLPPLGNSFAVDIGGYVGSVAIALALDNPELKVVCIEPVPENVELINLNIHLNGLLSRIQVYEAAAAGPGVKVAKIRWRFRGSELADHHAFVGNCSLAEGTGATDVQFEEEAVPCIALSDITGPIDFLKIDCEGCEWSVLTDPAVADIRYISGEWHPTGGKTMEDLAVLLGTTHTLVFSGPEAGPGGFKAVRK